ncbi:MAG: GDSL-type esterase/lipase family protein [Planctomycetia bacterium]|nr:GDSL-type esterase/lipase family protein [Planctomycetia bacterium]
MRNRLCCCEKGILGLLGFCCAVVCGWAEEPVYTPQPCVDFQVRGGIGNTLERLEAGETVRVAYLGGSITMANGWRVKTTQWLRETWPQATIVEIAAGVSGTGSLLGNYRLERDVLQHEPDLLLVEFAVNDGGTPPQRIWQQMEGIVRKTWAANPRTDIVFVYTFCVPFAKTVREGILPTSAGAMEMLAEFYGIPSIHWLKRVVALESAGKLVFQTSEEPKKGELWFSQDGTHPLDAGHELYREGIAQAFQAMKSIPPVLHDVSQKPTFVSNPMIFTEMRSVDSLKMEGDWRKLATGEKCYGFTSRLDDIWTTDEPGASVTFSFRGTQAMLYDVVGPDGGQIAVTVDGVLRKEPLPRTDAYCLQYNSWRVTAVVLADGLDAEKVHTVTVELLPEEPNRAKIGNDPKWVEKYPGRHLRFSKILVRGEFCR